jgi:hypothetical protein
MSTNISHAILHVTAAEHLKAEVQDELNKEDPDADEVQQLIKLWAKKEPTPLQDIAKTN